MAWSMMSRRVLECVGKREEEGERGRGGEKGGRRGEKGVCGSGGCTDTYLQHACWSKHESQCTTEVAVGATRDLSGTSRHHEYQWS